MLLLFLLLSPLFCYFHLFSSFFGLFFPLLSSVFFLLDFISHSLQLSCLNTFFSPSPPFLLTLAPIQLDHLFLSFSSFFLLASPHVVICDCVECWVLRQTSTQMWTPLCFHLVLRALFLVSSFSSCCCAECASFFLVAGSSTMRSICTARQSAFWSRLTLSRDIWMDPRFPTSPSECSVLCTAYCMLLCAVPCVILVFVRGSCCAACC